MRGPGLRYGPRPLRGMGFSQTSLSIDAAVAGQGVALACAPLVADEIAEWRLVRLFTVEIEAEAG